MRRRINSQPELKPNLLIINYAMDENSQVFSHQIEVVRNLAEKFKHVYVITTSRGSGPIPINVEVTESKWIQGKRLINSFRFIRIFLRVYWRDKNVVIFSHMTEVQSALISPLTRLLGVKHIIWYAHTSRSPAMSINRFLVDGIVTSTSGSCPYSGLKVTIIGQAIDEKSFIFHKRKFETPFRFVNVGRLDPSKKIEELISTVSSINSYCADTSLTIVGAPSSHIHSGYKDLILDMAEGLKGHMSVNILDPVKRSLLPDFLNRFHFFIHGFEGSLDKTLVEATLCGLPVLTVNSEYRRLFGDWSPLSSSDLEEQFLALRELDELNLSMELNRRYKIALNHHSSQAWTEKIYYLLNN
jgi:glycosyltransferase involved in cell wall biosynthesis